MGIADAAGVAQVTQPSAVSNLVLRPFAPAELSSALARATGVDRRPRDTVPGPKNLLLAWSVTARVTTVVIATLLQVAIHGLFGITALVVPAVLAYLGLSLVLRRRSDVWALADLVVATVAIAVTGGLHSPFSAFGIVAVATTAITVGSLAGALCGLIPMVGPALTLIREGPRAHSPGELLGWFGLFPLASLLGASLGRLGRRNDNPRAELATEANRILSALFRIARTIPGGFDLPAVAKAALDEVASSSSSPAGMLLLREAGTVRVAGSFGSRDRRGRTLAEDALPETLFGREPSILAPEAQPPELAALTVGHDCWIASPLCTGDVTFGSLLTACPDCSAHADSLRVLGTVAHETALAVENARLFAQVQELSANEERKRLGAELHDSVAQVLVHIRMELEMLSNSDPGNPNAFQQEASRLARVAAGALRDVQSTVLNLRSSPGAGLAAALSSYLSDIRSLGGPQIGFVSRGECLLPPHFEAEMFRVAQEAVSNALRHAGASKITVTLSPRGSGVALTVEDDGLGISHRPSGERPASTGVGLQSMKERARRLGGRLSIHSGESSGTRVELVVDADAPSHALDDILVVGADSA